MLDFKGGRKWQDLEEEKEEVTKLGISQGESLLDV